MSWNIVRFFQPSEMECKCGCGINNVNDILLLQLDRARAYYGSPMKVSSGCRCEEHNSKIGGVPSSSHISTETKQCSAVDIFCNTSSERYKMIIAFTKAGFNRIGVAKDFIHVDVDLTKPSNVMWTY